MRAFYVDVLGFDVVAEARDVPGWAGGWPLRQLSDHGTHEAVYLSDPDGNDLELAWDRPVAQWPHDADGHIAMGSGDLDRDDLLAELEPGV